VIAKRVIVSHCEISRESAKRYGTKHIAGIVCAKQAAERIGGNRAVVKDVEVVIHCEAVRQGVGIDKRRDANENRDRNVPFHPKIIACASISRSTIRGFSFAS
jgi:hypothetical protein